METEDSVKGRIIKHMKDFILKKGWIAILIYASIPNLIFDLVSATSGYFLVPFMTFFSATVLGKAIIKTHLQIAFLIFLFSKSKVDYIIILVSKHIPVITEEMLRNLLNRQQ